MSTFVSFSKSIKDKGLYGGIGTAWLRNESRKWGVLRRMKLYNNFDSFPNEILDNDLVIGHIRELHPNSALVAIENVHPFLYKNQIFIHNGDITDFTPTRIGIDKELAPSIKGKTDTEYMFYLFLTIKKKLDTREISEEEKIVKSVEELFHQLREHRKPFRANIVYANKSYSIITRYAYLNKAKNLYFNGEPSSDKLLISSLPVMDTSKMIPSQTLILVDHIKHKYKLIKLN
jgi:predicted glutamine amidotransferase